MTIKERYNSMKTHLSSAYTTLELLGVTMPENKNLENLADVMMNMALAMPVANLIQIFDKFTTATDGRGITLQDYNENNINIMLNLLIVLTNEQEDL